jgi:hypothetical protein
MSNAHRIIKFIAIAVLMIAIVFTTMWLLTLADSPSSYRRFSKKDPSYHKTIAEECERLFQNAMENPNDTSKLNPENPDLPKILRELHSYAIEIGKDLKIGDRTVSFVRLNLRSSTGAYSVIWEPCIDTGAEWQLAAYQEGQQRILWRVKELRRPGVRTSGSGSEKENH